MLAKKGVVAFTQLQHYQIVCYLINATNNIFECNGRHFSFIADSKSVVLLLISNHILLSEYVKYGI